MCCCGKPTINGQPGYRWQPNHEPSIRPVAPPEMTEGDVLVYDEPGRCGGIDGHSHHFRLVKRQFGGYTLLVKHGGGTEAIRLDCLFDRGVKDILTTLDTHARYWLLYALYDMDRKAAQEAHDAEASRWRHAARDKRIKVRKIRGGGVSVSIEPPRTENAVSK